MYLCKVIVLTLIEWWLKISSLKLKLYKFLVLSYITPSEQQQENTKNLFLFLTPGYTFVYILEAHQ